MGPCAVVDSEVTADRGPGLEDAGVGAKVNHLVFRRPLKPLDHCPAGHRFAMFRKGEDIVAARAPLPSITGSALAKPMSREGC